METHLRMGKSHRLSTELLDRKLGPCTGIPSEGAPTRISKKRELSNTSIKNHRAGSLHSLHVGVLAAAHRGICIRW
jgi:hypothetical protein